MEPSIFYNQLEQLKNNLVNDVETELKEINEIVYFTNTFFYVESKDPDTLCSLYGIENGVVIADGMLTGKIAYDIRSLPLEVILFVKNEINYYKKSKIISTFQ